jgi:hypothetical protein
MINIHVDRNVSDDTRRADLYRGDLFVYTPTNTTLELCELARSMAADAFHPHDPREAQHRLPVDTYAAILAELKPAFIHHPECKRLIPGLLAELGCDLEQTYFDVPRLRTSTSDNYLTTGIAFAFHAHRDTWYSAPQCQINWWLPVYDMPRDSGMAFHPQHWTTPIRNSSEVYNYAEWNRTSRYSAARQIGRDTRIQPEPQEDVDRTTEFALAPAAGGMIVFSAAQLHSSLPNSSGETRLSIDFRTVHLGDARNGEGAPNIDSNCTGTTMGDYLRGTDLAHLPDELIARYDAERRVVEDGGRQAAGAALEAT